MAISRVVRPELLDGLSPDDPEARRSRRDLLLINFLMGNRGWALDAMARCPAALGAGVVEIGAGDGSFCKTLERRFPSTDLTAIDLAPRPSDAGRVRWLAGDLFEKLPAAKGGILVGGMILHHFEDERLKDFGRLLEPFSMICFCEPWRDWWAQLWGRLMFPLVGRVTRHDMMASIAAGFRPGELPELLGLENWRVREGVDWRGSLRLVAVRGEG